MLYKKVGLMTEYGELMKKHILFLSCFIIVFFSGCGKVTDSDTDLVLSKNVNETTAVQTTENYDDPIQTETISEQETITHIYADNYEFPDGITIPSNAYYCRSSNYGEYTFYDKFDNVIQVYDDDYYESHEYEYNENGTIAVDNYNDPMTSETYLYTYNPDKTLLKIQTKGDDSYTLYEYDEHGQVIHDYIMSESDNRCMVATDYENVYENGNLVIHKDKGNGPLATETTYEYDNDGNITREINKSNYLGEILNDSSYTYYADGKIKSENINYVSDGISVLYEYEYIYFK